MLRSLMMGAFLLIIGTTTCFANEFVLWGMGASSCGDFAKNYAAGHEGMEWTYFSWAQGFMSALNLASSSEKHKYHNLAAVTADDQMRFLRAYCDQHPLGDYVDGVFALMETIPINEMPADTSAH